MGIEDQGLEAAAVQDKPSEKEMMDLTAEGQRVLGQGRADEALMMAHSILASEPEFAPALALQGDALERLGRLSEAYASYEKILALGKDTPLDRIRTAHLQRAMDTMDLEPIAAPSRRQALFAAAAASVLVICASMALVFATRGGKTAAKTVAVNNDPYAQQFEEVPIAPVPIPGMGSQNPNNMPPNGQSNQAGNQANSTGVIGNIPGTLPNPNSSNLGTSQRLPGPQSNDTGGYDPVMPGLTSDVQLNGPQPTQNLGGSSPQVNNDRDIPEPPVRNEDKRRDPGTGSIVVRDGSSPNTPTNNQNSDQEATALIRTARDASIQGDYKRAADAYEKALRMGAPVASTNQRLAQCYEKLGRKSDAIAAYDRALKAYEAQIRSGHEVDRSKTGADACRAALKVLRGG